MIGAACHSLALRVSGWSSRLNHAVEALLVVIALGMAMLTGTQVFFRYALNNSIFWSEEVGRMCLVWLCFLGATAAYWRGSHIGIGFLVERFPRGIQRVLRVLVELLSLAFFVVLILAGGRFEWFAAAQKTPALGLSKAIPYLVMPISGVVFLVHGLSRLLTLLAARPSQPTHCQ